MFIKNHPKYVSDSFTSCHSECCEESRDGYSLSARLYRQEESGRSMLEMIAVIVLMLLLLLVGLWGFKDASLSARMNTITKDISNAVVQRRYQIAQSGTQKPHTLSGKVGSTEMTVENKISGAHQGEFIVILQRQSKEICEGLKKFNIFHVQRIEINGGENDPCLEENEVVLYFSGSSDGQSDHGGGNGGGDGPLGGACENVPYTTTCCATTRDSQGCLTNKQTACTGGKTCKADCTCDTCPKGENFDLDNIECYEKITDLPEGCPDAYQKKNNGDIDECYKCVNGVKKLKEECDCETKIKETFWHKVNGVCQYEEVAYCPGHRPDSCTPSCACEMNGTCVAANSKTEGQACSDDACCQTDLTCMEDNISGAVNGQKICCPEGKVNKGGGCVLETGTCGGNLLADNDSCVGEKENCCESGNCANGLCCPMGQVNVNGVCCGSGISEGDTCTQSPLCCSVGTCQESGVCCQKVAENSETCVADACCLSGNCTGKTGNKHCCPANQYWVKECCPKDGTEGTTCASDNCCQEGLSCQKDASGNKTCQRTETVCTPCTAEGQICTSDECNNLTEWACDLDNNRCCPAGQKWLGKKCVSTNICPDGLKEIGESCSASDCCASGNCAKAEGQEMGLCCAPMETLIKNGDSYSCGQNCSYDFGKSCSSDNQCCGTQTCQRRFGKRSYQNQNYRSCECLKWKNFSCTDSCGGRSTCSECVKEGKCETYTKKVLVDDGMADKTTCCTGDGTLGSECSDECPCQGTAYIIDGKTEIITTSKEFYYRGCGCSRVTVPLLYCRKMGNSGKGICVKNSYVNQGKPITKPEEVNCANNYDFYRKDGLGNPMSCYRCPEGLIVLEDSTNIACCVNTVTKWNAEQCSKQYSKFNYDTGHSDDYRDGYYKQGDSWVACPKGYYCENGAKYPCPAGSYNDITAQTTCKNCTEGNYCPEGATKPLVCPIGAVCPKASLAEPEWCPAGTYTSKTKSSTASCKTCHKGYYCPGRTTQINCQTGGPEVEAGEESQTSKGYSKGYCPETGMSAPKKGNATNGSAEYVRSSTKVALCPVGYICDGVEKVPAPMGTYADEQGLSVGKTVQAGYCGADSKGNCVKTGAVKQVSCPAGTKGVKGECVKCDPNTYQDLKGQGSCKPCEAGGRSNAGATKCTQCATGAFAQTSQTSSKCCSKGQEAVKNEATGFQICCDSGKRYCQKKQTWGCYVSSECTNEVSDCATNEYLVKGKCVSCPSDSSCNGVSAVKCALGERGQNGICEPCPAGTRGVNGGCRPCDKNTISKEAGSKGCERCPNGTTANEERTKCVSDSEGVCEYGYAIPANSSTCKLICKKGQYYEGGVCHTCEIDYYCPDGINRKSCEAGKHAKTGAISCTDCKNRFWNPSTGTCIQASQCPQGFQCQNGEVSSCPPGTTSAAGKTECNAGCEANYYTNNKNQCEACTNGTWSNGGNATQCGACPGGTYGLGIGKGCQSCGADKYTNNVGSTSASACKTCGGRVYNDGLKCCQTGKLLKKNNNGEEVCTPCPSGAKSCNNWTDIICKAGYYLDGTSCKSCGTGKTSPAGSTSASACVCKVGYYSNGNKCLACPKGSYCTGGVKTTCPAGKYTDSQGQSSCKTCPAGKYTDSQGQSSCKSCPKGSYCTGGVKTTCSSGTYTDSQGQSSCKTCPVGYYCTDGKKSRCSNGKTSPEGSTSASACVKK